MACDIVVCVVRNRFYGVFAQCERLSVCERNFAVFTNGCHKRFTLVDCKSECDLVHVTACVCNQHDSFRLVLDRLRIVYGYGDILCGNGASVRLIARKRIEHSLFACEFKRNVVFARVLAKRCRCVNERVVIKVRKSRKRCRHGVHIAVVDCAVCGECVERNFFLASVASVRDIVLCALIIAYQSCRCHDSRSVHSPIGECSGFGCGCSVDISDLRVDFTVSVRRRTDGDFFDDIACKSDISVQIGCDKCNVVARAFLKKRSVSRIKFVCSCDDIVCVFEVVHVVDELSDVTANNV